MNRRSHGFLIHLPGAPSSLCKTRMMRTISTACGLIAALALAPVLGGCGKSFIQNTDVEDTKEHRDIITFCEQYRRAVERKDIGTLLALASPEYYEDGGNVDASDDIDYAGLKDYLVERFGDANAIRYEIRYRRILREGPRVFVDYTYSGSFRLPTNEGEKWRNTVEENRLELLDHGDTFTIVAGM